MAGPTDPGSGRDDRVRPATRWLSAAIIPFLVVAFVVLYPVPDDTERLFAWPVKPTMTPMILASVYLGGAYFFLRAATARQWHTVRAASSRSGPSPP
jgi:protein-S-isoprenylcysteine O-methyltransferase Ste14